MQRNEQIMSLLSSLSMKHHREHFMQQMFN